MYNVTQEYANISHNFVSNHTNLNISKYHNPLAFMKGYLSEIAQTKHKLTPK